MLELGTWGRYSKHIVSIYLLVLPSLVFGNWMHIILEYMIPYRLQYMFIPDKDYTTAVSFGSMGARNECIMCKRIERCIWSAFFRCSPICYPGLDTWPFWLHLTIDDRLPTQFWKSISLILGKLAADTPPLFFFEFSCFFSRDSSHYLSGIIWPPNYIGYEVWCYPRGVKPKGEKGEGKGFFSLRWPRTRRVLF